MGGLALKGTPNLPFFGPQEPKGTHLGKVTDEVGMVVVSYYGDWRLVFGFIKEESFLN
jgi:hypothetical protein